MSSTASACVVVRSGDAYVGRQGLTYLTGLTRDTAGTRGICLTVATLPPGARAKAHLHHGIETAVYIVDGEAEMYYGPRLEQRLEGRAGDYMYVPPEMPHLVLNRSASTCRAVVAHTASSDQDGIVLLPDLDALI
ncbi:MAG TPA: cupin domain-containing protein [Vicinamibacterales bacterium]|nr:cupin domain-containing protein [Vicinamibacterales bacterium]